MANQLEVKILGRDFSIACPENEEENLKKSINYLNHKIEEIQETGSVIGVDKTIIMACLLYTSDAADDTPCVDLGGRRIIK